MLSCMVQGRRKNFYLKTVLYLTAACPNEFELYANEIELFVWLHCYTDNKGDLLGY